MLADATVGLVGMGRIAKMVARRLTAWGTKRVVYYSRTRISNAEEKELGVHHAETLEALLSESDVISLHVPSTSETKHLLGSREFAMCKKGARLVNTARGDIVDEEALVQALKNGQISGAALDVYEHEPKVHLYLRDHDMVLMQPHTAAQMVGLWRNITDEMLGNMDSFLGGLEHGQKGVKPKNAVNDIAQDLGSS
ncbi:MAG: hypothetical protein CYPHOPRED_002101 [Cyphobasidiales sp. Tagirdzhanova-0007]|nr:MAG: hypothetical protein CYPHOPRED_002101 [Cyphobasidiales sp. Tagirdzhanova-0007]